MHGLFSHHILIFIYVYVSRVQHWECTHALLAPHGGSLFLGRFFARMAGLIKKKLLKELAK